MAMTAPRVMQRFARVLAEHDRQCWLVGGAVRDLLMRRNGGDYDVATDARPEQVRAWYRRTIPTGLRHGTVTVVWDGHRIEVTTFRSESSYGDGRHPDQVTFGGTIEQDLGRRDFTINAIALDLLSGRLVDPYDGRGDLARELIRAIGAPAERFAEDGLRPLRLCRFAAQLGFGVHGATLDAIPGALDTVRRVSAERIRVELEAILLAPVPSTGLSLMEETGLMELVLPELHRCVGVEQPERHCFDVFTHALATCDASAPDLELRLAGLLHDVGKPASAARAADGSLSFHRHERVSTRLTRQILDRLRFPHALRDRVSHLVAHHMFNYDASWSDAAVRRFVARVGRNEVDRLLSLRRADQIGRCRERAISTNLIEFEQRIGAVLARQPAFTVRDLAVGGRDLMDELQLAPGPIVGILLRQLLETVLDDPGLNRRDSLLTIARNFHRARLER